MSIASLFELTQETSCQCCPQATNAQFQGCANLLTYVCVCVCGKKCVHALQYNKVSVKEFKHIHRTCQLSYAICIHMTPNSNSYCFSIVPAVLLLLQAVISHRNPRLPTPTDRPPEPHLPAEVAMASSPHGIRDGAKVCRDPVSFFGRKWGG